MNSVEQVETSDCSRRGTPRLRWGLSQILGFLVAVTPLLSTHGEQPLPLCAVVSFFDGNLTLLLDPVSRGPVALLSDPSGRLPTGQRPLVLQTAWQVEQAGGLPRLRLGDALPEFWAQPSVWRPFLKGPEAFAGIGNEPGPRDWAGMPSTDRRSYRLDPGLAEPSSGLSPQPGGGSIGVRVQSNSLRLAWRGAAGQVYELRYTSSLARPFEPLQTVIAYEDGEVQVTLPINGSQGFYHLTEIKP